MMYLKPEYQMPAGIKQMELYYIDDNLDDVFLLRYQHRQRGNDFPIHIFSGGHEAIMALEQCLDAGRPLPSLLVTDLYMPVMDGIEIVHRIKSNPAFMSICVAVCSGSSDPADQRMARDAGADFHLEKPLDIDAALDKYQVYCRTLGLI